MVSSGFLVQFNTAVKPLEKWLKSPDVTEIMVNPSGEVWIDQLGKDMENTGVKINPSLAETIISLVASATKTTIGATSPIVSAELPDGSRFEGLVPPVVANPSFSIRKHGSMILTLDNYVEKGTLTPEQKTIFEEAVVARENILVVGGTGCHAAGTKILMSNGSFKYVEDIKEGDTLMGPDSLPRKVLKLHNGTDMLYRIIPFRGEPFIVNAGHIMALISTHIKNGDIRDKTFITVQDYLKKPRKYKHIYKLYHSGPLNFLNGKKDTLPVDPYFLGVLIGDGSFVSGVSITNPEPEIYEEIMKQATKYKIHVNMYFRSQGNPIYKLCSERRRKNRLIEAMKNLGLYGLKGEEKFVPPCYQYGSIETRRELLAGLLDTDGYLSGHRFDIVSKSKKLADSIVFIARSLGLYSKVSKTQKSCPSMSKKHLNKKFTGTYFRVYISGDIESIPVRVPRRKTRTVSGTIPLQEKRDIGPITGFKVEPYGIGQYFGFEVDHDNLYLSGDFIVHHNSGKTTLSNAIVHAISVLTPDHRVITIEDTLELKVSSPNLVSLRTSDNIDITRLLKSCMRLRPDRILVGEVRGPEALALLKAWNTGHPGGVATVHANNSLAGLTRLEQLVQEAGITDRAARPIIAEAVNLIVFIEKTKGGRKISEIRRVLGYKNDNYDTIII